MHWKQNSNGKGWGIPWSRDGPCKLQDASQKHLTLPIPAPVWGLEPLTPSPGWRLQAFCPRNKESWEKLSPGRTPHPSSGQNVTSLANKENEVSTWTEHIFLSSQRGLAFQRWLILHTTYPLPDTPSSALGQKPVLKQSVNSASSFQRCPYLTAMRSAIKTGGVSQEKKPLKESYLLTA